MKSFEDFMAVNGANLTVGKGEIVAVIGPNGAGKTTFFNLITGALKRDRGRIVFKGRDISELPPYEICRKEFPDLIRLLTSSPGLRSSRTLRSLYCPIREGVPTFSGRLRT